MVTPEPSPFFRAHLGRLREAARLGPVVDVACGAGRHARAAAEACDALCVGMDRRSAALGALCTPPRAPTPGRLAAVQTNLETEYGAPLAPVSCGALLVFQYLWRPLIPQLTEALKPGGLLLYETFTESQRDLPYGPENPDFLLHPGELVELFPTLVVLEHHEGSRADGQGRPWHLASLAGLRS